MIVLMPCEIRVIFLSLLVVKFFINFQPNTVCQEVNVIFIRSDELLCPINFPNCQLLAQIVKEDRWVPTLKNLSLKMTISKVTIGFVLEQKGGKNDKFADLAKQMSFIIKFHWLLDYSKIRNLILFV